MVLCWETRRDSKFVVCSVTGYFLCSQEQDDRCSGLPLEFENVSVNVDLAWDSVIRCLTGRF